MESAQARFLTCLVVFKNTLNEELIRSLHVYRFDDGKESEVEREFVFAQEGSYVEMEAHPLLFKLESFRINEILEGQVMGSWLCIFVFNANRTLSTHIPSLLSISRNPKLNAVPMLVNDLQKISDLSIKAANKELVHFLSEETSEGYESRYHQFRRSLPVLDQDLNLLPHSVTASESPDNQEIESSVPALVTKKRKRAATEDIARIALDDLAKYFDVPIAEASKNLKVGLTVLKKKCREFGIPRWPHRKIKSLDSLIRDLQEEAERQRKENESAAMAVAKRQKMLESEKEGIESNPFMEIQNETKRFRQDVFKRRHRARALRNQC